MDEDEQSTPGLAIKLVVWVVIPVFLFVFVGGSLAGIAAFGLRLSAASRAFWCLLAMGFVWCMVFSKLRWEVEHATMEQHATEALPQYNDMYRTTVPRIRRWSMIRTGWSMLRGMHLWLWAAVGAAWLGVFWAVSFRYPSPFGSWSDRIAWACSAGLFSANAWMLWTVSRFKQFFAIDSFNYHYGLD